MNPQISKKKAFVWTKEETATGLGNAYSAAQKSNAAQKGNAYNAPQKSNAAHKGNAYNAPQKSNAAHKGNATQKSNASPTSNATQTSNGIQKSQICKYWVDGNCVKGDRCLYMHKWFSGEGFSMLAKLQGHKKAVTGIALPERFNKLYSSDRDGATRVWDCHTGCIVSEGPWIFIGVLNLVKAWNIESNAEFNLDGPHGQVHAIVVGNEMVFAGAPVWDLDTLQCVMTLKGHSGAVMSLICWDHFLISCSLACTIKLWAATEWGSLEVTYTHNEEHWWAQFPYLARTKSYDAVLDLAGMIDPEMKPILLCSCNDNTVRLLELPSFFERGKLFEKREVRRIEVGPGGLFFSGDATGLVSVWKWMDPYNKVKSS